MNKHESCIYYLFKETFTEDWFSNVSLGTLVTFRELLQKLLDACNRNYEMFQD